MKNYSKLLVCSLFACMIGSTCVAHASPPAKPQFKNETLKQAFVSVEVANFQICNAEYLSVTYLHQAESPGEVTVIDPAVILSKNDVIVAAPEIRPVAYHRQEWQNLLPNRKEFHLSRYIYGIRNEKQIVLTRSINPYLRTQAT